ncbi:unnamed protein product, partial [Choristocarpus tenellus]
MYRTIHIMYQYNLIHLVTAFFVISVFVCFENIWYTLGRSISLRVFSPHNSGCSHQGCMTLLHGGFRTCTFPTVPTTRAFITVIITGVAHVQVVVVVSLCSQAAHFLMIRPSTSCL